MNGKISFFSGDHGPGVRTILYLAGCEKDCKWCNAQELRKPGYGDKFIGSTISKIFDSIRDNDIIAGITVTGGEPLLHYSALYFFLRRFKKEFPNKTIWLYTGYTWEDAMKNINFSKVLKLCDVVVDGEYMHNKKDTTYSFRGSTNERIIDVKATLMNKSIVIYSSTQE